MSKPLHADAERHIAQWLSSYRLMRYEVQVEAIRRLSNEAPLLAVAQQGETNGHLR